MRSSRFVSSLVVLACWLPAVVVAATVFEGDLDGPAMGTDSPATGFARLVLDDAQAQVAYEITYAGLVGVEILAHIHNAPPGELGRIVHDLPLGTPKIGTWDIPAVLVGQLVAGNLYVTIHSDEYPGGEIGGWVAATSSPTAAASWSAIRTIFR
ncbi:MAG TPA: CHRD domain-containing protein [Candidatus Krumholzibacteria bacterium]|nr:CHRD domain-containing protein [Candidatus Krumholzibacteria bacterium]HPD70296.1 CHRD domain-containing protein [Candidatus Krumholzibacteria bacterium]HRY40004.1 CHRD domain-containing protein [Candidatus Krumholzibacteria bacterium]